MKYIAWTITYYAALVGTVAAWCFTLYHAVPIVMGFISGIMYEYSLY